MSRSFSERLRDSTWWLEQSAHAWIGAGASLFASVLVYSLTGFPDWALWFGVGAAAIVAIAREMAQNIGDKDNNVPDAVADALFTWLGGWLVGIPWLARALL